MPLEAPAAPAPPTTTAQPPAAEPQSPLAAKPLHPRLQNALRAKATPSEMRHTTPPVKAPQEAPKEPPKPEQKAKTPPKAPDSPADAPKKPDVTQDDDPAGDEAEDKKPATETEPDETETETAPDDADSAAKEDEPVAGDKATKRKQAWKLVEQYKAKARELEREVAELRSKSNGTTDTKETTDRLTKAEARVQELEGELRIHNAEKFDPDFQKNYHQPYLRAFQRAMADLDGVMVSDTEGNQRPITADDLSAIALATLPEAKKLAAEKFGEFAPDVLATRNTIKSLWDQRQAALEDLRKNGSEMMRERQEKAQKQQQEIGSAVTELWKKANDAAITDEKHGQYFQPRESDPEWNQRLEKGFQFVDRVLGERNPHDPRLTPAERKTIIERHAAMRLRAAAFGPLRFERDRLAARVKELEAENAQYKQSEPSQAGGSKAPKATEESGHTLQSFFGKLRQKAAK